jgi:DNA-binding NarL/FixJ family response regulator
MPVKQKILIAIAEDHELFREGLTSRFSKEEDMTIAGQFENGQELLLFLSNHHVDIVLMDIQMPVMDGITATRKIAEQHPHTKVIALTMHDNDSTIMDVLQAGAYGYLLKNTTFKEITQVIVDVYEGKKSYAQAIHHKILGLLQQKKTDVVKEVVVSDMHPTEIEIIKLICKCYSAKEIGEVMKMSDRTVEGYKAKLLHKFDAKNTIGLVVAAIKHKLVDVNDF